MIISAPPEFTRPPEGGLCPASTEGENWIEFGGYCYLFASDEMKTFSEALIECSNRNSELLSIHSDEETDFLVAHIEGTTVMWQWMGLIRADKSQSIITLFFFWTNNESILEMLPYINVTNYFLLSFQTV